MTDLTELIAAFTARYGEPPANVVRAPGRVNLIGEHIDYNGLSVLPMAIQRRVTLLFRPRTDPIVRIANTQKEFSTRSFALSAEIEPYPEGDWGNYLKAAAQALAQQFGALSGFDAVMTSDIPVASGLSSSSALTVAAAMPLVEVNRLDTDRTMLAELLARAERYVGTEGGGMDQAVCLGASEGAALRVDFEPLRMSAAPIPNGIAIVVASSLVRAEKSGAARDMYNRRTRECREALEAVLGNVKKRKGIDSYPTLLAKFDAAELVELGDTVLGDDLRRRFRHVVSEAARVTRMETALAAGDVAEVGRILNESHASLRDDYAVSTSELDELTELAVAGGASGARLTGAGLGGCIVAACPPKGAEALIESLTEGFYQPRSATKDLDQHLFVARPSGGTSVEPL
ncbi:MAG: galactokinase [Gemmatimonadota bacterium]|nr:MAG: galactokinase [Gemmatimonadota bacterium]